jgi:hypothetical protein
LKTTSTKLPLPSRVEAVAAAIVTTPFSDDALVDIPSDKVPAVSSASNATTDGSYSISISYE